MYRDYEDTHKLEALLAEAKLRAITCGNPYELIDIYEEIWTLQDRLNAAYQDEEFDLYSDEVDLFDDEF